MIKIIVINHGFNFKLKIIVIVVPKHKIMLTSRITKDKKEKEQKELNEVLHIYICSSASMKNFH